MPATVKVALLASSSFDNVTTNETEMILFVAALPKEVKAWGHIHKTSFSS
jgi:hypothetical protein